jgi:hypothetical protein
MNLNENLKGFLFKFSDSEQNIFKELKMANEYIFTSESVTEGHPDKMADQ